MIQYGWQDCPQETRTQIETFVNDVRALLEDDLIGVYLHGSLAMGCFNSRRSDVDLLLVTQRGMSLDTKRYLTRLLLKQSANPHPLELSFLTLVQLHPWQYPAPYDYHYSEDWRERMTQALASDAWRSWNDKTRTDPDLAAHVVMTYHRGITLYGPPIADTFPIVPETDYWDSVIYDVKDAHRIVTDNPVYGILNLCRAYWYALDQEIGSKDEAGMWALDNLPAIYRSLVQQALDIYRGDRSDAPFDADDLRRFADFMSRQVIR